MGVTSSQCHNCGAALASDQRYCLNCGERRGRARFSLASMMPVPAVQTTAQRTVLTTRSWGVSSSISSSMLFVGFIALLLGALAVGVLIGHTNTSQVAQRDAAPKIEVLNTGGGTATPSAGTLAGAAGSGGASSATPTKVNPSANTLKSISKAPVTKKVAQKAAAAASKVIGGSNLPPPTVKPGQKGSGAGYQGGQFTGNFFGN